MQQVPTNHRVKSCRPKLRCLLGRLVDTKEFEVAKVLRFTRGETEAEAVNLGKVAKPVSGQRVTILVCGPWSLQRRWLYTVLFAVSCLPL